MFEAFLTIRNWFWMVLVHLKRKQIDHQWQVFQVISLRTQAANKTAVLAKSHVQSQAKRQTSTHLPACLIAMGMAVLKGRHFYLATHASYTSEVNNKKIKVRKHQTFLN